MSISVIQTKGKLPKVFIGGNSAMRATNSESATNNKGDIRLNHGIVVDIWKELDRGNKYMVMPNGEEYYLCKKLNLRSSGYGNPTVLKII